MLCEAVNLWVRALEIFIYLPIKLLFTSFILVYLKHEEVTSFIYFATLCCKMAWHDSRYNSWYRRLKQHSQREQCAALCIDDITSLRTPPTAIQLVFLCRHWVAHFNYTAQPCSQWRASPLPSPGLVRQASVQSPGLVNEPELVLSWAVRWMEALLSRSVFPNNRLLRLQEEVMSHVHKAVRCARWLCCFKRRIRSGHVAIVSCTMKQKLLRASCSQ